MVGQRAKQSNIFVMESVSQSWGLLLSLGRVTEDAYQNTVNCQGQLCSGKNFSFFFFNKTTHHTERYVSWPSCKLMTEKVQGFIGKTQGFTTPQIVIQLSFPSSFREKRSVWSWRSRQGNKMPPICRGNHSSVFGSKTQRPI